MHFWLYGWDWSWLILMIVSVIALAVGLYFAAQLTDGPTSKLR